METKTRSQLLILCVLCILVTPILLIGLLWHTLVGSQIRALRMAIALDECGNALFGGLPTETISSRVGRRALSGLPIWTLCERSIDFFFGRGHCQRSMLHALRYKTALDTMQRL